jgi:hypothetical protein
MARKTKEPVFSLRELKNIHQALEEYCNGQGWEVTENYLSRLISIKKKIEKILEKAK